MAKRGRNAALARLLAESGLSETQFAARVNRLAAEVGLPARYEQPSVSQWLNGTLPRVAVRPLVAEALTRKLGRPVSMAEIGFPNPRNTSLAPRTYPHTVDELIDLVRSDMDPSRRGILSAGLYSVALSIPAWPDIVGRFEAVGTGRSRRIGMADVTAVASMTERLCDLDDEYGGRFARPMAAAFIANNVAPCLRADTTPEVRKELLSAVAFLCYATGWMAVDEGLHGLAQQYYVKGLELSGAGSDHLTYCHILRGMSVQAADLGHGKAATRLADAAAEAAPDATPRMRAFFAGQQAHSYALAGDRTRALRSMHETERAVDKAESQAGAFGGYGPSTVAYHLAQVRYALGDVSGSVESFRLHFRLRDNSDSRRSSIRFNAMMAERQLEIGHLEAACAVWGKVLTDYPSVHSGRVDDRVRRMKELLYPYRSNSTAREVYDRARALSA